MGEKRGGKRGEKERGKESERKREEKRKKEERNFSCVQAMREINRCVFESMTKLITFLCTNVRI